MGTQGNWTDERVAFLRERWAEGARADQIADELGGGVTTSAVIGKAYRLRLFGVGAPPAARIRGAKPRAPRPDRTEKTPFNPSPKVKELTSEPIEIPTKPTVSLLDLSSGSCRWPMGDVGAPGFGFCGQEAVTGMPYCAGHCRLSYGAKQTILRRPNYAR